MNYIELLFDNNKVNKNKIKKEWIEKNIPNYFKNLCEFEIKLNINIVKYSQLVYHYEKNMLSYPNCDHCNLPNKRFIGFESGYKLGCSKHCAILLTRPKSNETRRLNTIKKYGVEHTTQLDSVKEKMRSTNLKRHGVEYASRNANIMNKIKLTNNIKYGCDMPLQNSKIKDKMFSNFILKYGYDNPIKMPEVIEKIKIKNLKIYGTEWHISSDIVKEKIKEKSEINNYKKILENYGQIDKIDIVSYKNNNVNIYCHDCNNTFEISTNLLHQRYIKNKINVCLICNPINNKTSNGHIEIVNFIKDIGINNIIINDRNLISPYEIDIYLPDYKIAIEFNGIYWHSELIKDKEYHHNKHKFCKELGIELIQIWEDDWNYKSDIIKSIIKSRLNRNISIGARSCKIRLVSDKDSKIFLNENHLQGWCISKIRYGLFHNNTLVALMTFSNGRKNLNSEDGIFEITRFCNKLGINIVGSFGKLWKHFIKNNLPNKVISYSDNDLFNGDSYLRVGMKFEGESINYWWCDGIKRYNRWGFRKDKLIREGFDKDKTEYEIMSERGWYRCYGSGNKKFTWLNQANYI